MRLIVGTYGNRIWLLDLDSDLSAAADVRFLEARNASYLALSPDGRHLFAVSESGADSALLSFALPSGEPLSVLGDIAPDPCHLLYVPGYYNRCGHPDDGMLLTADYSGGSVSLYPVQAGRIAPAAQVVRFTGSGPVPRRQEASHIHQLTLRGNCLLATDLGADCIHVLRLFDATARPLCDGRLLREPRLEKLFDLAVPAGSGPRHLTLSADGRILYLITELTHELLVYALPEVLTDPAGIRLLQRFPVGDPTSPTQAGGDIHLSPDGRHLYASLRNGGDGLVVCDIGPDGTLRRSGFQPVGAHPRNFCFLPDESRLAVFCKNGRCIQFYRRDAATGGLRAVNQFQLPVSCGEPVFGLPYS